MGSREPAAGGRHGGEGEEAPAAPEASLRARYEALRARHAALAEEHAALAERHDALARTRESVLAEERLRAIGEVASGVAHELNNTLHALTLRLARLRADGVSPEQARNLDVVDRIARDAAARVRRLQDLARSRDDVPAEAVDVRALVAGAIAAARPELAAGAGPRVTVESRLPHLPAAVGCAAELHHVLLGLLLNARDAMPDGGRVVIDGRAGDGAVVVEIADEGSGIAPEHLARVFDPFFTTKGRRGTGLGLSIAAGVMRRLGGAIEAANRPGGGAVFTLRFPRAAERRAGDAGARPEPLPLRRVLVVDDDEDNLDASRWMLEHLGQRVEVAACGDDALGRVAAGERYDLVLCDLGMPGLDGWTVTARLRDRLPDARIYLVTGWAEQLERRDPRRASLDGVLPKPLGVEELQQLLRRPDGGRTGAASPAPSARGS